jgi:hypothetical protein
MSRYVLLLNILKKTINSWKSEIFKRKYKFTHLLENVKELRCVKMSWICNMELVLNFVHTLFCDKFWINTLPDQIFFFETLFFFPSKFEFKLIIVLLLKMILGLINI